MLPTALGLLLSFPVPVQDRPLVQADALFDLPGVDGPVLAAGDVDGDGKLDLFVEKAEGKGRRLEVISLEGETLVRLWLGEATLTWDAGGDVDGDGVADLVLGLPRWRLPPAGERAGVVQVLSGADGSLLRYVTGEATDDRVGCSVAFVGDVDGDGCADFALGAMAGDGVQGTEVDGRMIRLASARRGWVAVHSGRTGEEVWRVEAGPHGHGFGARVQAMGDVDGDGKGDLLVQCVIRSREPALVLSGADGHELRRFGRRGLWAVPAGDVDGDGAADVAVDEAHPGTVERSGAARLYSGATGTRLGDGLDYPDWLSEYGVTVALGDLDGDGYGEIGLGDPNFGLRIVDGIPPVDVTSMGLEEALTLQSWPRSMYFESGCARVHSGRTREVLMAVFGASGSVDGVGLHLATLPDVNGDGFPDLVIGRAHGASIFAGPGKRD